ncbi:MAG: PRC-barrel domain containing protein [Pedobacter sp.]|nr:MAG: PRC-barrel domain containing protein [Pedobacter sp.]
MEMNESNRTTYLEELSKSNFEIADHQPDITGWEIVDSLGNELGEVEDLIFDSREQKVRYIVASLDLNNLDNAEDEQDSRLVLIPIGILELDEDDDEVVIPNASAALLATVPEFEPGKTISPAEELAIRYAFLGQESLPNADAVVYESHAEDFYNHGHFDDAGLTRRITGPTDENSM